MPKWIASLVGKWIGKKIKLGDNTMDEKKPWYKSKTILSAVVAILLSGYATAAQHFGLPAVPEWAFALLAGLGVYGRATATTTIK
jgi:hypothetical protein